MVLADLFLQPKHEPRVNLLPLHFPFEKHPESLTLLDVECQLGLELLDLGELESLLEVGELLVLPEQVLIDLLQLLFQN